MKLKLLMALSLLLSINSFAQCPPDGVFNSQAEIDAFAIDYPNCDQIGYLQISGSDITDLTALSNINIIDGLSVQNNLLLTTLEGLENIQITTNIGNQTGLGILNNPMLMSIEHLPDFSNPTSAFVQIQDNPSLLSLNGVNFTEVANQFFIRNNDALINLTGLENLTFADLIIEDNNSLMDLQGLGLYEGGSAFQLDNNFALTSLNGLNPNANLSGCLIKNNASLSDISQLSFGQLISELNISGNSSLSICNVDAICNALVTADFDIYYLIIENNAQGCNNIWQISNACEVPPINNDIDCNYNIGTPRLIIGESLESFNSFATTSSFVPSCNEDIDRQDVWYYFTGESNSVIDLEVTNGFSMQLWQGECDYDQNPSVLDIIHVPNACSVSSIQNITITEGTDYFVQVWLNDTAGRNTTFGDFEVTLQDATLSFSEVGLENFKVFPNPFKDELFLSSKTTIDVIQMYDVLGNRIETIEINEMQANLNLTEYSSGIYFLKAISGDSTITRKIIKE